MTALETTPTASSPLELEVRLAALGARYDAAPRYPAESLTLLASEGWGRRFAPVQSGGTAYDDTVQKALALMGALRSVGRSDLSVGRLFEGHVNALALFDWYADPAQKAWLGKVLAQGAWFGVWATEPPPGVRLVGDRLQGAKMFATGAGSASRGAIGVVVVFGVLVSTLLSLFVVPAFYALLAPFTRSPDALAQELERLEAETPAVSGHA